MEGGARGLKFRTQLFGDVSSFSIIIVHNKVTHSVDITVLNLVNCPIQ